MDIQLRCKCGKLRGSVDANRVVARAVCYCRDCQAFARFLKKEGEVLDAAGGTEVEATRPSGVRLTSGLEHLACMSLSPRGIYRWYASCCGTPIGNTPRDAKVAYVGLVRACLMEAPEVLDRQLGRKRFAANTKSAHGPVPSTPLGLALAVVKIGSMITAARLGGGYRDNPFFDAGEAPVRVPRVLSREERAAVTP
ncbi:hypothetical protein G4G28_14260 [Massilia sp. Dwa41.01b]|uniref:DUF6151 family protein n=1 Tax=unclassified Massilia TaxID=2609279 RepID=UPI0016033A2E|nr:MULTISPECIES: DUF6151 family protein [unclassified Massilia]QNA89345.1 hypothetical protein G4G28_14260 [Massilia sp. Dwa41.01b]QNB00240.1 hypothetical protein G4G31_17835 [Massilia sp. Se16.2.3]